jgi:glycosyltransferase 2 family protein
VARTTSPCYDIIIHFNNSILKKILLNILKFSIFLGIGLAIMTWFYTMQNTAFQEQLRLEGKQPYPLSEKLMEDFRSVNLFWIAMTLVAFTLSNWSRAIRWNMLIKPLGYTPKLSNLFFAVNISYFANLWMSRAGEVVRAGSLAKVEKMSVSRLMGTVVVDRILDMITLMIVVGFGFLLEYETLWGYLDKNIGKGDGSFRLFKHPVFLGLMGVGVVSMVLLYVLRKKIAQSPLVSKVWHIVEKFGEGLKTIKHIDNLPLFLFHSINIWVMYYMMTFLCFYAFAPTAQLPALAALTVFVFGTFGIVIPSPGGMGTYHVLATAALVIHGVNSNDAFSFANIMFFSIQIFYTIVAGVISIILMRLMNKNQTPPLSNLASMELQTS